jgi:tetratricopeptide (TPR) repeat protein
MELNASPLELRAKADDLYSKQEYLAAADVYRKLAVSQPGNTILMKQLGLSLTMGKQVDEGMKTLKTAAVMQPADPEIRYAYGYALGMAERFDEAIDEFDAALNLSPNHIPARQGLIYSLLTSGQAIAEVNPMLGEQRLDRAHKLDPKNPHVAAANLGAMVKGNQKGKAVNFVKDLDSHAKTQSPLKELIEKLESDPDFQVHMKQASMAHRAAAPNVLPQGPGSNLKQVPCPACRLPIMDYAAICPHCNFKIRATGTFAGRDTGPKHEWQEIAYTIMSLVVVAFSILGIATTFGPAQKGEFADFNAVPFAASCIQLCFGLGLLFRQGWIGFIAKIFLWIRVAVSLPFFAVYFLAGRWIWAGTELIQLAVAGFMIYLINYVIGD